MRIKGIKIHFYDILCSSSWCACVRACMRVHWRALHLVYSLMFAAIVVVCICCYFCSMLMPFFLPSAAAAAAAAAMVAVDADAIAHIIFRLWYIAHRLSGYHRHQAYCTKSTAEITNSLAAWYHFHFLANSLPLVPFSFPLFCSI